MPARAAYWRNMASTTAVGPARYRRPISRTLTPILWPWIRATSTNCASESCPPLAPEAFRADLLDQQLDALVRAWLADASLNRFDRERRRVEVSEIFDWFAADFERDAGSVRAWIARYAPSAEAAWLKDDGKLELRTLPYSWKLNAVPQARR